MPMNSHGLPIDPRRCCKRLHAELDALDGKNSIETGGTPINVVADLAALVCAFTEEADSDAFASTPGVREAMSRLAYRASLEAEKIDAALQRCRKLARAGGDLFLSDADAEEVIGLLSEGRA